MIARFNQLDIYWVYSNIFTHNKSAGHSGSVASATISRLNFTSNVFSYLSCYTSRHEECRHICSIRKFIQISQALKWTCPITRFILLAGVFLFSRLNVGLSETSEMLTLHAENSAQVIIPRPDCWQHKNSHVFIDSWRYTAGRFSDIPAVIYWNVQRTSQVKIIFKYL